MVELRSRDQRRIHTDFCVPVIPDRVTRMPSKMIFTPLSISKLDTRSREDTHKFPLATADTEAAGVVAMEVATETATSTK